MDLSPEDRKKIYEEEKERMESEGKQQPAKPVTPGSSKTNLKPNVAALLCYVGGWISGIVFLILEPENKFVKFHAIQSIIVFGFLNLCASALTPIPFIGWVFGVTIGIIVFVFWVILMVFAYRGELYKVPAAGELAARFSGATEADAYKPAGSETKDNAPKGPSGNEKPVSAIAATQAAATGEEPVKKIDRFNKSRAGRITGDSFAIAWCIVLLIFFNFYNQYIKLYEFQQVGSSSTWVSYPFLTSTFSSWLIILNIVLGVSILIHIILIAIDRYILNEVLELVLNVLGIVTIGALLFIYPFDFSNLSNSTLAAALPAGVISTCGLILLILTIVTVVRLIKLIVNLARNTPEY